MGYFSSSDYELCYNKTSVDSSISRIYDLLDKVERYRLHMIDDVSSLERIANKDIPIDISKINMEHYLFIQKIISQLFLIPIILYILLLSFIQNRNNIHNFSAE